MVFAKWKQISPTCRLILPRGSSHLHCSPCSQLRARCHRAPDWGKKQFPVFSLSEIQENEEKLTWAAISRSLSAGAWRKELNRLQLWSLQSRGWPWEDVLKLIEIMFRRRCTWRESSWRLFGAACPSWRRPWPWCCRLRWRRQWCQRRWLGPPSPACFLSWPVFISF